MRNSLCFLLLALFFVANSEAFADEPPAKARVEFRWVESKFIESVTEEEGFQCTCDPKSIVYAHKKPALVLSPETVAKTDFVNRDLSRNGLSSQNYSITVHLTEDAKKRLADTVEGVQARALTVVVDGKYWGVFRYEKDENKRFVPKQCRADSFTPSIGLFSDRLEAKRVVAALND